MTTTIQPRATVDQILSDERHDGITPDRWEQTETETWHAWLVEEYAPTCACCLSPNHAERYESRYDIVVLAVCDKCGHAQLVS